MYHSFPCWVCKKSQVLYEVRIFLNNEYSYEADNEKYEVYCLRHRPFPLVKEICKNEKEMFDEITSFADIFDQSMLEFKYLKKWSDRDRKELMQRV